MKKKKKKRRRKRGLTQCIQFRRVESKKKDGVEPGKTKKNKQRNKMTNPDKKDRNRRKKKIQISRSLRTR